MTLIPFDLKFFTMWRRCVHFVKTKKHSADWRKYWSILEQAVFILPKPPERLKRFPGAFPSILLNVNPIPPTWISLRRCPFLMSTLLKKESQGFCTILAAANLKEYLHASCSKACSSSLLIDVSFSRKWTFSPPLFSLTLVGSLL